MFKHLANFNEKNKKGTIVFKNEDEYLDITIIKAKEYLDKKLAAIRNLNFRIICESKIYLNDMEHDIIDDYLYCINYEFMETSEYMEHIKKGKLYNSYYKNNCDILFHGYK